MPQFSFDAAAAPVMTPMVREPLPPSTYQLIVAKSDVRVTRAGDGEFIELEMQVIDGPHQGRRLWERFNVSNQNKRAEDYGRSMLRQLCVAVGVNNMTNTEQLHDIPFMARIEIDRKEPTRNKIVGYESAGAPAAKAPAAPARPAAPAGARPWAR